MKKEVQKEVQDRDNNLSYPPDSPKVKLYEMTRSHSSWELRWNYVKKYGFVLLSTELLDQLAAILRGKKVVELASGTGTLGALLRKRGVDITITDIDELDDVLTRNGRASYGFTPDFEMDVYGRMEKIDLSYYDVVLLTWSPYGDDCAEKMLKNMLPGQILVHNGEGRGGCTETEGFHEAIRDHRLFKAHEEVQELLNSHHVKWVGMHDQWVVVEKLPAKTPPSI